MIWDVATLIWRDYNENTVQVVAKTNNDENRHN